MTVVSPSIEVAVVDGLTKILPDRCPDSAESPRLSGFAGQTVSFQIAWRTRRRPHDNGSGSLRVEVVTNAGVRFWAIGLVPVRVPCWDGRCDGYLTGKPSMMPDLLRPLCADEERGDDATVYSCRPRLTHVGWHGVWVDLELPSAGRDLPPVEVRVFEADVQVAHRTIDVEVVPTALPDHGVEFTQWFHADCLATYYGVEPWSEAHWRVVAEQLRAAAQMGVTMVLTPLWTPPLDTAPGSYRPTVQLLDISCDDGVYHFGTDRLERWIRLLEQVGIAGVEVPHLFTQWGARLTPRFRMSVDGEVVDRFGWDTLATDPEYAYFLSSLVPFLKQWFESRIGLDHVVFHVSDEPNEHHLESYRAASDIARPLLEGARTLEALSHPEYIELVDEPVVATDAVLDFRRDGIEPAWVYHCVAQDVGVSNRFIAQESVRTRALGWQLWKFGVKGFLHWGFNFYYGQLSVCPIDPFADTSAGGGFISGDAFIVYPGPDGVVWPSLRHRLVRDAFVDLAAARTAESLLGRSQVLSVIDPDSTLGYDSGWVDSHTWLERRHRLDHAVAEHLRGMGRDRVTLVGARRQTSPWDGINDFGRTGIR